MTTTAAAARTGERGIPRRPWLPAEIDRVVLGLLVAGLLVLYLPSFAELSRVVWSTDEQGQGPIVLAVSAWLFLRRVEAIAAAPVAPLPRWGWPLIVLALAFYWVGQTQDVLMFASGSLIPMLAGLLLVFRGGAALRLVWFPLFLLVFVVPLPGTLVAAVTAPLKSAVSVVAAWALYHTGYPVARSGVVLQIGQYQLLVADACAGLNSMFTLEALGLVYMNLMKYTSVARNVLFATLLVPIAFVANVVRVIILVLVTYHFGDAAGQGFVHGFAGIVLFVVAVLLMVATDLLLGRLFPRSPRT